MKRKQRQRSRRRRVYPTRARPTRAVGVGQVGGLVLPMAMVPAMIAAGKALGLGAVGAAGSVAGRRLTEKLFKRKRKAK